MEDKSFAGRPEGLETGGEQGTDHVTHDEDLEAEAEREHTEGEQEGLIDKVKEKGKELLNTVSGPDVPPSLGDEEKR
jgi:hypothetical protein